MHYKVVHKISASSMKNLVRPWFDLKIPNLAKPNFELLLFYQNLKIQKNPKSKSRTLQKYKTLNIRISENINNNEYLPGRYTDLTSLKHKRPLHSAPNHEYLDFFRGFPL